ncbi:hypothetical protein E2C01_024184 [Portunus trituberculatus]|uniref:Uncharacterized protein n=1 Tax=Portunus trituberculatus TaxID=210409 RepID=A0A5B7EA01_PORTR|nr:hypothetical protein [Portunus trituberculatus]
MVVISHWLTLTTARGHQVRWARLGSSGLRRDWGAGRRFPPPAYCFRPLLSATLFPPPPTQPRGKEAHGAKEKHRLPQNEVLCKFDLSQYRSATRGKVRSRDAAIPGSIRPGVMSAPWLWRGAGGGDGGDGRTASTPPSNLQWLTDNVIPSSPGRCSLFQ